MGRHAIAGVAAGIDNTPAEFTTIPAMPPFDVSVTVAFDALAGLPPTVSLAKMLPVPPVIGTENCRL